MNGDKEQQSTAPDWPLQSIYFYLTAGCNLRCRHCWIAPPHDADGTKHPALSFDLFKSIVDQARPLGLGRLKLTGGEPLLAPDIDAILEWLGGTGIGLTVETNGVLCTPGRAEAIAACVAPSVAVSLDGANAETHETVRGVPGCFEAALQGVRNLVDAGLDPQLIMTLFSHNRGEVEDLVELAKSVGAESVKFNIAQPSGRGNSIWKGGKSPSVCELIEFGHYVEEELAESCGMRLFYSYPSVFRSMRLVQRERNGKGCNIKHIIGVLGDGSYALCGIGQVRSGLVFGNAAREPLKDVWENTPLLNDLREGLPERLEGICSDCVMKRHCLGYCIAQNWFSTGNLWAPFWFCKAAFDEGEFPSSRHVPSLTNVSQEACVYD
ncbi:MAG: SynChlorMet cassette radical SAM/SPASM protein ScmF [bacterium]|nr:SynChlorMet cassette radical SAM/SPASM protein ScmF [bacterium]